MTARDATVAAELVVPCREVGRDIEELHRVHIHRDGSVTAPDHEECTEQQVLTALGEESQSACHYWVSVPSRRNKKMLPLPDGQSRWAFTYTDMWTTKAAWTALAGIAGENTPGVVVDPVQALALIQAFAAHGSIPENLIQMFSTLASPVTNERGWRRVAPVSAAEVSALLDAGVPADRVGAVAAMGVSPEVARVVLSQARRARVPAETLVYLANAVDPERLPALVDGMDRDDMNDLLGRVNVLRERLKDGVAFTTEEVFEFLRG